MIPLIRVRCQEDGNDKRANDPIHNPYTPTGKKVMSSMQKKYGAKKGKSVFFASMNKNKMKAKWEK